MDNRAAYEHCGLSSFKHIDLVCCHCLCVDYRFMQLVFGCFSILI